MPKTVERPVINQRNSRRVAPSIVDPGSVSPFTLEQELQPFGQWVGDPVWVPPKDSSDKMAETMLRESRPFASRAKRWEAVLKKHRHEFTQVREFNLYKPSIRLPQGRFFVTVTEQNNFDQITDTIPACVQTRLDEFLAGPGKKRGVKVYYLKPLCVELNDELIMTTQSDLQAAIQKIQHEVFAEYSQRAAAHRSVEALRTTLNIGLAIPRRLVNHFVQRQQRKIDEYQARLEFKRRKTALGAARTYRKCRTTECTFDEMLDLTNELKREEVVDQYCTEREVSKAKRAQLMRMAAGTVPWFVALGLGIYAGTAAASTISLMLAPPVLVCDPAFVAEMPGSNGTLLKIGHFDEVDGVTHVEI